MWAALSDRGSTYSRSATRRGFDAWCKLRATDCLAAGGNAESCGMPRQDAFDPLNPAVAAANELANVYLLDLSDAVCGPRCAGPSRETCSSTATNTI